MLLLGDSTLQWVVSAQTTTVLKQGHIFSFQFESSSTLLMSHPGERELPSASIKGLCRHSTSSFINKMTLRLMLRITPSALNITQIKQCESEGSLI